MCKSVSYMVMLHLQLLAVQICTDLDEPLRLQLD